MPKKNKTLCVDDLRHAEYYGMQPVFDELYHRSLEGENFTDLMDLILSRDNILLAYRNIKANGGSYTAGTDNKNISDIGCLPPETVAEKVRFIVTGSQHGYRPKPVRRKDIPKPNGKTRPLGIPCIWDRLVQQCIKQVIEPICEAKFSDNSYGFRPNRSVEHAVQKTYTMLQRMNLHYVIEFDIKGFFDNVNHSKLMRQIWAMGIHDKQLIFIIKRILKAPIRMPDGTTLIPDKGTPQGGIISHPLTGLMYCADCGAKMYVHRVNNGKRIPQYTCSAYSKVPVGTLCPTQHRINADIVMELIKDLLKAIAEYSHLNREEFIETVKTTQNSQQSSEIVRLKNRIAEAKKRLQELEKLICRIYEDNILGKLPDERYAVLDGQYSKEQKELTAEISELEAEVAGYENGRRSAERFIALVDKYQNFDELTTYMLNEFVEKILVHERDRKGSQQTTQEIEIYFNFVGRYLPPHFGEVQLTPEEEEELRKREARKDRLHQNYLRRKANGKQKEYEDKVKEKRKAEIEAKKEAIRQEDITKGVFVPVSMLPAAEPKKGVVNT